MSYLPLSVMDKFDGTTKRKDLESVIGTYTSKWDTDKLISVGDKYCTFERKDGSKFRLPSGIAWNKYFY